MCGVVTLCVTLAPCGPPAAGITIPHAAVARGRQCGVRAHSNEPGHEPYVNTHAYAFSNAVRAVRA